MKRIERGFNIISCREDMSMHYPHAMRLDIQSVRLHIRNDRSNHTLEGAFPINIPGQMIEYEISRAK